MGIRFICRETDTGAAANIGGPVQVRSKTFTDQTQLEKWLRSSPSKEWVERELIGVELIEDTDNG